MVNEVKRYTDTFVSKGRALGELGHPDGPQINLDRVSHKIVDLRQEGNNFIGKAQILSTPMGKMLNRFWERGQVGCIIPWYGIDHQQEWRELCWRRLHASNRRQTLLPTLLLLMLSLTVLWKVKNGSG